MPRLGTSDSRNFSVLFGVVQPLCCVRLFCSPIDCSLPGSSAHGISQGRLLECVASQPLLFQGIFLTQGPSPRLLHWQADSLPLSYQGCLVCTVWMWISVWKKFIKVLCYHGIYDSMKFSELLL